MRMKIGTTLIGAALLAIATSAVAQGQQPPQQQGQIQATAVTEKQTKAAAARILLQNAEQLLAHKEITGNQEAAQAMIDQAMALLNQIASVQVRDPNALAMMTPQAATLRAQQVEAARLVHIEAQGTTGDNKASTQKASEPNFALLAVADHGRATPLVGVTGDILEMSHRTEDADIKNGVLSLDPNDPAVSPIVNPQEFAALAAMTLKDIRSHYPRLVTLAEQNNQIVPRTKLTLAGYIAGGNGQDSSGKQKTTVGLGIGPKLILNHGQISLMAGSYWPDFNAENNAFKPRLIVGINFNFLKLPSK